MKKFAIIGKPVINSQSPSIYNYLFQHHQLDAHYTRLLITDIKNSRELFDLLQLDAINVTMPYKQLVYGFVQEFDDLSKSTETCNTILFKDKIFGYNTDYLAFSEIFNKLQIQKYQNILLLGAGNTAITVLDLFKKFNLQLDIANRTKLNIEMLRNFYNNIHQIDEKTIKSNYDVIINTSADLKFFEPIAKKTNSNILIDFNYIKSPLIKLFTNPKIYIDGYEILMKQAYYSFKIYCEKIFNLIDFNFNEAEIYKIIKTKAQKKSNIALIGMTNVGKTELSRAIAKELKMDYISIDELVSQTAGKSIDQIFSDDGEEYFRNLEREVITRISSVQNTIIDTGGGSCLDSKNVDMIKSFAYTIFLVRKPEHIWDEIDLSNRPLLRDISFEAFKSMFQARLDSYFKCSDLIYFTNSNLQTTQETLLNELTNYFNADYPKNYLSQS